MKDYPEGYPLKNGDAAGRVLKEGDEVQILKITDDLLSGLDDESRTVVKGCENTTMKIHEIDDYGFVWFEKTTVSTADEYESHRFCVEPVHLRK